MKEVIIHPGPRAELIESAIPSPNALQVVIKVVVSGTNPKDWKESYSIKTLRGEQTLTRIYRRQNGLQLL